MKKTLTTIGLVMASLLAGAAYAQTKGEAEPPERQQAAKKATPAEKDAAKAQRKAQGAAEAKAPKADDSRQTTASNTLPSKEERKDAAAKRKVAVADAVKKGQTPSGEK